MHTGGEMLVGSGVHDAYTTGNGSITLRALVTIEGDAASPRGRMKRNRATKGVTKGAAEGGEEEGGVGGRQLIVVTEVPYQVNKVG